MKKKDILIPKLELILTKCIESDDIEDLISYLKLNSNLPEPRGNLELGQAFSEIILNKNDKLDFLKHTIEQLLSWTPSKAPVNDPKEFLAFCGTLGLGSLALNKEYMDFAFSAIKKMAKDSRWRVREAVAKALEIIAINNKEILLLFLNDWIKKENDWLSLRAIAAGTAESLIHKTLKEDKIFINATFELHKIIFNFILEAIDKKSEEFRILRKGLGFTLSLVVFINPNEGFEYLEQLINTNDKDVLWIVKENLKKKRLIKNFPKRVEKLVLKLK
ncbi:MAG: hypothetical protein JXA99_09490 [Candidatus Lokiarchaeota archaeon]|nr:hypothetical protein [Candidatus Lokiarchaeota archaeon]